MLHVVYAGEDGILSICKYQEETLRNFKSSIRIASPCSDTKKEHPISALDAVKYMHGFSLNDSTEEERQLRLEHLRAWTEFENQCYEQAKTTSNTTCCIIGDGVEPVQMATRGLFLLFEGRDRSGKSTQAKILQQSLINDGHEVEMMHFPYRRTEIGTLIDAYLNGTATLEPHVVHLLFSANRWESASHIKEVLESGVTIVMDRYAYSGIAFSAAASGLDVDWCTAPDVGLPLPDLVFYMEISDKDMLERGGFGEEIYERLDIQQRVHKQFNDLSTLQQETCWIHVDASGTVTSVANEIYSRVSTELALTAMNAERVPIINTVGYSLSAT